MKEDVFYDIGSLSRKQQEVLLRKAYSISERWWVDKLCCEESFARQKVNDISFEEAMRHFIKGAVMNVIERHSVVPLDGPYREVSFRSMESPVDYFLWILVPLERADKIVTGLTQRR